MRLPSIRTWLDFLHSASHSLKTRLTLLTLTIFWVSIWSLSYYLNAVLHSNLERALGQQQFSTVSVVAGQVNSALVSHQEALGLLADSAVQAMQGGAHDIHTLLKSRPYVTHLFNSGVVVVNADGKFVTGVSERNVLVPLNDAHFHSLVDALREGKTAISAPIFSPLSRGPVFAISVPLKNAQGNLMGALVGMTDLGQPSFLDEVTQNRYGKTGGYMIVARAQRQIVAATDKSLNKGALPAAGENALLDRFLGGYEGSGTVANIKGVTVLASAKGVPVAGWYVAVALPASEAFAPIHDIKRNLFLATLLITCISGWLMWWILKRQMAPMQEATVALARMVSQGSPPQPLIVKGKDEVSSLITSFNLLLSTLKTREDALKNSEYKLSEISENVDSYIYIKDTQGRYLFANKSLRQLLGLGDANIEGKTDGDFFDELTVVQLQESDRRAYLDGASQQSSGVERTLKLKNGRIITAFSIKIPLKDSDGNVYGLCGISSDITERQQAEQDLRIAAIAFECQEAIVVLDAAINILRVNQAFCDITGYDISEAYEKMSAFFCSTRSPTHNNPEFWSGVMRMGPWKGVLQLVHKSGDLYPAMVTVTAVKSMHGEVTHFVCSFINYTSNHLQEQKRVANEIAHRDALVREVHHRIKNNLQGIMGLMAQFAHERPEISEPINQVIGQIKSISVIHGLQGRTQLNSVRLCELTSEISIEVEKLWQSAIEVNIPPDWIPRIIAEKEAVPISLVLNELIVNAVKHNTDASAPVKIAIHKGADANSVTIEIFNVGRLDASDGSEPKTHSGLQLIKALLPRTGAVIQHSQQGDVVCTSIQIGAPILTISDTD